MDIFLTADAVRTLRAIRRLETAKGSRGFLLGHRRGERFYIESVLPSPSSAWPSLRTFYETDSELGGKIIGFFLVGSSPAAAKPLLQPFGTGKVLVESASRDGKKPGFRGAIVDYNDRFEFRALPVIVEKPTPSAKGERP